MAQLRFELFDEVRIAEEWEVAAHRKGWHASRTIPGTARNRTDTRSSDLAEEDQAEVVDVDEVLIETV